jgi:hypothetical protein
MDDDGSDRIGGLVVITTFVVALNPLAHCCLFSTGKARDPIVWKDVLSTLSRVQLMITLRL